MKIKKLVALLSIFVGVSASLNAIVADTYGCAPDEVMSGTVWTAEGKQPVCKKRLLGSSRERMNYSEGY